MRSASEPGDVLGASSRRTAEIFPKTGGGRLLAVGACEIDLASGRVSSPDGTTELRPKTTDVLRALAASPGTILGKDALLEAVWPGLAIEEDGLVQCISEIRQALGPAGRAALRTHAKRGYALHLDPPAPPRRAARRSLAGLLAVVALAAVGGLALLDRLTSEPPAASAFDQPAAAEAGTMIAVLPFETLTPGERWERLATGLTRDVISDLATNDWLFVLADAATRYLDPPSLAAAQRLGARYVVTGVVQVEGGVAHVAATLADAASGRQIWARRVEGPTGELLRLQRTTTEALVGELAARWSGPIAREAKVAARRGRPSSLAAYEMTLLAGERMDAATPRSFIEAEALLKRAVALEPDYGAAWAKSSLVSYNRVGPEMTEAETEALWAQAGAAALNALRVAPDDPMALGQAANVVRWEDPVEAERMIRKAAALAPSDADILAYLAFRTMHFPALAPDAVAWIERAIRLNPARPKWYDWNRGAVMMVAGRYCEAAEAYARAPDHIEATAGRLAALALAGEVEAARAGMADLLRAHPQFTSRWYAEATGLHPDVAAVFNRGFALAGTPAG